MAGENAITQLEPRIDQQGLELTARIDQLGSWLDARIDTLDARYGWVRGAPPHDVGGPPS